jgi:hypothetical protein
MAAFLSELDACLKDDDKIWELDFSLEYQSDMIGKVVVPAGFQTDFASMPRWIPIASNALLNKAHREGALHDYLYRKDCYPKVTRKQADDVFLEAMIARGKPWYVAHSMWLGVRIGGWAAFQKLSVFDKLCAST